MKSFKQSESEVNEAPVRCAPALSFLSSLLFPLFSGLKSEKNKVLGAQARCCPSYQPMFRRVLCVGLMLCIFVSLFAMPVSAANNGGTYSYVQGDTVNFIFSVLQTGETLTGKSIVSGSLPDGMSYSDTFYDSEKQTYLIFSGKITSSGTYKVTIRVNGSAGGYEDYDFTFNVAPSASEKPDAKLKVTKSPTSESVTEGGKATFISTADNYTKLEWRIVTPDGSASWRGRGEIEGKFSGVSFNAFKSDDGKEYLVLSNIPMSMNGYYVQTKFWGADDTTVFTDTHSALITVKELIVEAPKFSKQPDAAELTIGSSCTLEVAAKATDGTVSYQWYKNSSNSTAGGQKIDGATGARYSPEQVEGQCFYYCSAWAVKNSRSSEKVYSNVVSVSFVPPETPNPSPSESPFQFPSPDPDSADDEYIYENDLHPVDSTRKSFGILTFLLIVSALALVAIITYFFIASKKASADPKTSVKAKTAPAKSTSAAKVEAASAAKKDAAVTSAVAPAAAAAAVPGPAVKPAPAVQNGWYCSACGHFNAGHFCPECGMPKPIDSIRYICSNCGWKPDDPSHPPKFCPNCGDPFDYEDITN